MNTELLDPPLVTRRERRGASEASSVVSTSSTTEVTGSTTEAAKGKSVLGRVWNVVLTLILVAVVALAGAVVVVPRVIGAQALTVLSGSMLPTYRPGDLVVVRPVDPNTLVVGDVVTFQPNSGDPTLITHRITALVTQGGEVTSITTQGDANNSEDRALVPGQIMGRVVYSVPFAGHLRTRTGALALAGAMGVALIAYAVVTIMRPEKDAEAKGGPTTEKLKDNDND